jgi:hypothetical protein
MDNNCQIVVFSDKAYNAIVRETFEWEPVETGGILLGHILDNGCWIVIDVLPPGYGEGREGDNVYHEYGYFEYNRKFVNYLAKSVAEQYDIPLELLGLWHRHPGSMDHFSGTDDGTNATFAQQNPQGTISGLINVDPQLRMTMYYLSHDDAINRGRSPLNYQKVQVEVGSDLIPEEYFRLRYYRGEEKDIHPYPPQRPKTTRFSRYNNEESAGYRSSTMEEGNNAGSTMSELHDNQAVSSTNGEPLSAISDITEALKKNRTLVVLLIIAIVVFALSLFSIKKDYSRLFELFNGDKPSIENPTNKPQTDGLPQSDSASEKENIVGGDTKGKKDEKIPEPSKESGKPGERN